MSQARDSDRDAAIKVVRSACEAGRIVEADRDMRIEQLKHAQTVDEIAMHIRDLQPAPAAPVSEPIAPPPVYYGPSVDSVPEDQLAQAIENLKPKIKATKIVLPLVIVLVIAVVAIGGVLALADSSLKDSVSDTFDEASSGSGSGIAKEVNVLSAEGYQDLLDAVEEQTGSTRAYSAVLYPTYAVVELPVDADSQRSTYWSWDGSTLIRNSKSISSWERYDLSKADPATVSSLLDQVRGKIDEATSWYAIVRAPDSDRAVMWAYATNDYGETAYLGARRDGTITYDSTEH